MEFEYLTKTILEVNCLMLMTMMIYVAAITLVALGTSLPDTFASRTAAMREQFADNSIGNINGSNSVNVFLGLGLPWMIAAIHHQINVRT